MCPFVGPRSCASICRTSLNFTSIKQIKLIDDPKGFQGNRSTYMIYDCFDRKQIKNCVTLNDMLTKIFVRWKGVCRHNTLVVDYQIRLKEELINHGYWSRVPQGAHCASHKHENCGSRFLRPFFGSILAPHRNLTFNSLLYAMLKRFN